MIGMKLQTKIVLYLVALHLALAFVCALVLLDEPALLFFIEPLFIVSLLVGYRLLRAFFIPLELIQSGTDVIRERDFTSTLLPVGHLEMDELIAVYNRMVVQLRDERLRVEEQSSFLEKVLQASPSGVITCDFDGRIVQMNRSAENFLQQSLREAAGRRIGELSSEVAATLENLDRGESTMLATDGRLRIRCWRGEFVERGFPRVFYLLDEMTDVLRATERAAYEKLIRMMSHEVNNSVGSVSSLLDSLLHYASRLREEEREDFSRAVSVASDRLGNLDHFMRGFAEVVRLPEPDRRATNLRLLVEDIVTLYRPTMLQRRIELLCEELRDVEVAADKNQLEQAIVNVLKNAIEASGEGGRISVHLESDPPALLVRDSGAGITPEIHRQLFTPFFSTKREGRGLGLTLVQEVVRNHGFSCELRNGAQGGAEFLMRFD